MTPPAILPFLLWVAALYLRLPAFFLGSILPHRGVMWRVRSIPVPPSSVEHLNTIVNCALLPNLVHVALSHRS